MLVEIQLQTIFPTDRYIKKFIGSKVKLMPEYTFSKNDRFGNYLYDFLGPQNPVVEMTNEKYNDKIVIAIPRFYENCGKLDFKTGTVERVNSIIQDWFFESLYDHVNLCHTFGLRFDKSIESFCNMKGIEIDTDIQYETLRKRYQRYRDEYGNPTKKYALEIVKQK